MIINRRFICNFYRNRENTWDTWIKSNRYWFIFFLL